MPSLATSPLRKQVRCLYSVEGQALGKYTCKKRMIMRQLVAADASFAKHEERFGGGGGLISARGGWNWFDHARRGPGSIERRGEEILLSQTRA